MIGGSASRTTVGQRVLRSMTERLEPREIEKAAIALHGVDEAENAVEPRAIVGACFPGDDLATQGLEHSPTLGREISN